RVRRRRHRRFRPSLLADVLQGGVAELAARGLRPGDEHLAGPDELEADVPALPLHLPALGRPDPRRGPRRDDARDRSVEQLVVVGDRHQSVRRRQRGHVPPGQDHEGGLLREPGLLRLRRVQHVGADGRPRHDAVEPAVALDGAHELPALVREPHAAPGRDRARERRRDLVGRHRSLEGCSPRRDLEPDDRDLDDGRVAHDRPRVPLDRDPAARRAGAHGGRRPAPGPCDEHLQRRDLLAAVPLQGQSDRTGREYHSTAILLPDGRVLMAGGGQLPGRATNIYSGEIYSPPYLFKGNRPTITSAPSTIQYGSQFTVATPDASSIQKVALIRTPSVTHAFDQNQRYIPLSFTQGSGQLTVQAPSNPNTAPPGYYMLWILNGNGVPSVASFVRFPAPYEDTQAPTAPTGLAATGGAGTASLQWNASTDNVGVKVYDVYRSTTSGFTPSPQNKIA